MSRNSKKGIQGKATLRESIDYKLEQFIAKGPRSIFLSLTAIFIALFLLSVFVRAIILLLDGSSFQEIWDGHLLWNPFLQMTDPGNMAVDSKESGWLRVSTVLAGMAGIVILSSVIAFMTTTVDEIIRHIRKGTSKILVRNHTLILGWNEQVVEILKELIIANESKQKAHVVILGNTENEIMTDFLNTHLRDRKTTQIITAPGDSNNVSDLQRVGVHHASSIIVISEYQASADTKEKIKSDDRAIKTLMAIQSCISKNEFTPSIIVEGFTQDRLNLMKLINPEVVPVNSWELMGKILLQTSLTSGLEIVIKELLSFDGSEIYFLSLKDEENKEFIGKSLYDSHHYLKNGIPIGIYNESSKPRILINPENDPYLTINDELIVLASDDSDLEYREPEGERVKMYYCDIPEHDNKKKKMSTLFLGWHDIAESYVNEVEEYDANAHIDIAYSDISEIQNFIIFDKFKDSGKLNFIETDPSDSRSLIELKPYSYDNVIILSQDIKQTNTEKIDSDTIVISLLLKEIGSNVDTTKTQVVTQLLNSDNETILQQTNINDFVVSNRLINMYLTQLSENEKSGRLFDELFSEEGSEIYLKPSTYYFDKFPVDISFHHLMDQVNQRNEICIGYRYAKYINEPDSNYGVVINPVDKNVHLTIEPEDYIIVVAEDDT